ncbi:Cytochrome P450 monooxygenase FUM15 [Exophiala dermatitidis]
MPFRFPEFLSTYRFWLGSSLLASFLLVKYAPEYTILRSYTWTASAIFVLCCLVYFTYSLTIYPRFVSPLRDLPTVPGGSFFGGQFPALIKEPSGVPLRRWANEIPNDGLIRYFHLFGRERLLITEPKALAEVLTTKNYDFIKPELLRSGLSQVLGVGILLAEGDEHKAQRKNLMPAFHFRHIKELYPIFWSKSMEMVQCIQSELEKAQASAPDKSEAQPFSVEIGEWVSRATLDIIGVAGMGQDLNALHDPTNELNRVYRAVFTPDRTAQLVAVLQFFLPPFVLRSLPLARNKMTSAAAKVARDTAQRLVDQKKKRLAEAAANAEKQIEKPKQSTDLDITSVALESGGFTDKELVDNMMTFLAAGHETTASAFTWAVYMLCQHPEIQTRLRREIHQHLPKSASASASFGSSDSDSKVVITHDMIDNMPYLHAVCQETLRLWAPVPLTLRKTAVDTSIQNHFVPRDTMIILSPWAVNHNFALWGPDADKFNPDRWMAPGQANAGGAVSNYAFLTFLHGPRSCIGMKFAQAEFACLVAAFVGSFEFSQLDPDEVIDIKGGITARPKNGLRVILKSVSWESEDEHSR